MPLFIYLKACVALESTPSSFRNVLHLFPNFFIISRPTLQFWYVTIIFENLCSKGIAGLLLFSNNLFCNQSGCTAMSDCWWLASSADMNDGISFYIRHWFQMILFVFNSYRDLQLFLTLTQLCKHTSLSHFLFYASFKFVLKGLHRLFGDFWRYSPWFSCSKHQWTALTVQASNPSITELSLQRFWFSFILERYSKIREECTKSRVYEVISAVSVYCFSYPCFFALFISFQLVYHHRRIHHVMGHPPL